MSPPPKVLLRVPAAPPMHGPSWAPRCGPGRVEGVRKYQDRVSDSTDRSCCRAACPAASLSCVKDQDELQGGAGLRSELQAVARRPLFLALLALACVEAIRLVVEPSLIDLL